MAGQQCTHLLLAERQQTRLSEEQQSPDCHGLPANGRDEQGFRRRDYRMERRTFQTLRISITGHRLQPSNEPADLPRQSRYFPLLPFGSRYKESGPIQASPDILTDNPRNTADILWN